MLENYRFPVARACVLLSECWLLKREPRVNHCLIDDGMLYGNLTAGLSLD